MSNANILVVEDEIIVAKNIQNRLEQLGYTVSAVISSGEDAIKKAEEIHPDLILMDIKLDGEMDGIEAAKHIHNHFDIPIIYLTAYADDATLQRAKVTEPYGYIVKPFEERELQSNISIALYKHKMENKLKESKKYLQHIINSASEIIISLDTNKRILMWNKAAEAITGYRQKEVIQKQIPLLNIVENLPELEEHIDHISNGNKVGFDTLILKTKNGERRILRISPSSVKDENERDIGVLLIGRDITYEQEQHGKLSPGHSYLLSDESITSLVDLLTYLTQSGYTGLFITRGDPSLIKNTLRSPNIEIAVLTHKKFEEFEHLSDLDAVITMINEFSTKNANALIALDRIDYLITRFSFEKFIEAFYKINDSISENHAILLLHLPSSLLDERQMTIITNEIQRLPSETIETIEIEDELYDIMKFIYEQNKVNSLVPFKKIKQRFLHVYSTIAIKLKVLEDQGLIVIKKYGRFKAVYVSEKGKLLINRKLNILSTREK